MKLFTPLAFITVLVGCGVAGCSSNPTANTEGDGGTSNAGTASIAGTGFVAGSSATAGTSTTNNGGSESSMGGSGVTTGGTSSAGGTTAVGGTTAHGGSASGGTAANGGSAAGGASSGGSGGTSAENGGSAGAGGMGPLPPYIATCGNQKYTPTASPGAACKTTMVPPEQLISAFEDAGVAPGWGVYPNVDGSIGFTPTTATPSAGGANDTAQSLAFKVVNLPQGIKIQVGFGTQCQDVRNFKGLSFWAKGTIEGATQPFIVTANTLVIQLGSEKSTLGGCEGAGCSAAPPDKRITISSEWREYRVPFDCFGDAKVFDGYYTNVLFNAFGPNSNFAIDEVGYY
ncbi:MAG TPA: hypothetical protein VHB79_29315 [Polyangiaceae bacterium]|nr:hypothetical protein [Polyangiaceae bacterium]